MQTKLDIDILSKEQRAALRKVVRFLQSPDDTFVLIGAAGTGKSFLVRYIMQTAIGLGFITHRTASTNKAARIIDGGTIHSLLGLVPENDYENGVQKLKQSGKPEYLANKDLVVIDESSMVDTPLLEMIFLYASNTKLIFVGDNYQLPPIFEENSPALEYFNVELKVIQRQALTSPIIPYATKFREVIDGAAFPVLKSVAPDIKIVTEKKFKKKISKYFKSEKYNEDIDFCRVLAWTNAQVLEYNKYIRGFWYPGQYQEGEILVVNSPIISTLKGRESLVFKNESFVKVMSSCVSEKHGIEGQELSITDAVSEEGALTVAVFVANNRFDVDDVLSEYTAEARALQRQLSSVKMGTSQWRSIDAERRDAWKLFFVIKNEFADVRAVHANTVHKSQGSTYDTVFIDVDDISKNTNRNEVARLMYVAITRASRKVFIKGQLPMGLYR